MDKTDRLRDYGLAFLLYEQGLGICGYELIRELFIFIKLILNSYLVACVVLFYGCKVTWHVSGTQSLYMRNNVLKSAVPLWLQALLA